MQNPHCTIICFDYERYYINDVAEIKWIAFAVLLRTQWAMMMKEEMKFTRLC